jgi:murein DD-endopeptidase MepM/ murein hydrolase activator NlpD
MSRKMKGGPPTLFFIVLLAALLMIFLAIFHAIHLNAVINVKRTVALSTDLSDKGTVIISLMSREYQGKEYIRVMGESTADNYDSSQDAYKSLKTTLSGFEKDFKFEFQENPDISIAGPQKKAEYGECGHTEADLGIKLTWPSETTRVTSGFGYRNVPRPCYCHSGVDIATAGGGGGDEIYAAFEGKVVSIYDRCQESPNCFEEPKDDNCDCNDGFGNGITLEHAAPDGRKFYTHYYHLREIKVKRNHQVKAGDLIGISGNTGRSEAPHLHFELATDDDLKDDSAVNPCPYFENTLSECEKVQIAGCSIAAGTNVFSVDIPLPGAADKLKGKVVMERW